MTTPRYNFLVRAVDGHKLPAMETWQEALEGGAMLEDADILDLPTGNVLAIFRGGEFYEMDRETRLWTAESGHTLWISGQPA